MVLKVVVVEGRETRSYILYPLLYYMPYIFMEAVTPDSFLYVGSSTLSSHPVSMNYDAGNPLSSCKAWCIDVRIFYLILLWCVYFCNMWVLVFDTCKHDPITKEFESCTTCFPSVILLLCIWYLSFTDSFFLTSN